MNNARAALQSYWGRLSARERSIAGACALMVGSAFFFMGLVQPYVGYLAGLQTDIESRQIKLAKYRRWLNVGERIPGGALPAAMDLAGAENEDVSRFLRTVEQLARASGARIVDLKPLRVQKKGIEEKLGADLQLESNLPALAGFLYQLQAAPPLLEVNRFQLSSGDGPSLRAALVITQTLFLAEPVRPPPHARAPINP